MSNDGTLKEEMGGMKDRVVGTAKDAAGAVTGDRSLEREGEAQAAYGDARQENNDILGDNRSGMGTGTYNTGTYNNEGTAAEEVGGFKDRVVGSVKDTAGEITGDRLLEREGEAQNAVGNARQENNDVLGENRSGTSSGYVTGMFRDRDSAERAYNSAISRGYDKDDVSLMMSDKTRDTYFADGPETELGNKALEGAGAGAAIGGTLGAILAGIAAIGTSVLLPGLGLIVAGPLAAALAGAGAGGLTGGLVGALVGSGIPEEHAKYYEEGINDGGIVMGVKSRNDEDSDYFANEWKNYNGERIYR